MDVHAQDPTQVDYIFFELYFDSINICMFGNDPNVNVAKRTWRVCSVRAEKIYGYNSVLVFEVICNLGIYGSHFKFYRRRTQTELTLWLHKQYGKVEIISCNNSQYHSDSAIFWISLQVNSKDGIYFAILFTLRESRRTSDPVLLRVRSKKLRLHPQTPWL